MKIHPLGAELLHADGQTGRHTDRRYAHNNNNNNNNYYYYY